MALWAASTFSNCTSAWPCSLSGHTTQPCQPFQARAGSHALRPHEEQCLEAAASNMLMAMGACLSRFWKGCKLSACYLCTGMLRAPETWGHRSMHTGRWAHEQSRIPVSPEIQKGIKQQAFSYASPHPRTRIAQAKMLCHRGHCAGRLRPSS